ncbi:MAG: protein kinase [Gemmatimonadetes bacterium]|nr:protein kinase [Gemmatimonadota bacterium]
MAGLQGLAQPGAGEMIPGRWSRIEALFDEALRREGAEHDAFLARLDSEDAALAAELRSLLSAHEGRGPLDELADAMTGPAVRRVFRLEAGDRIGPYRVEREIGSGGMATVYLARDGKHDRPVAIKVLRPGLAATLGTERFLREIEIASSLTHPHILPLFDSGEADGLLYYVMPYVEGESLRERLARETRLPVDDAIRLADQISSALAYAHERRIVHRDIKPENILLTGDRAVVADFGIARALAAAGQGRLTLTGTSIGTCAYMSPEQARGTGAVDGRTDLYSLGCVMYEMVAGQVPFDGPTPLTVLAQHSAMAPPRLRSTDPAVPLFLERAVQRAMAKDPRDRFRTAREFADALTTGTVVSRLGRRRRTRWLKGVTAGAMAGALLLAAGSALPSFVNGSGTDRIAVLPLANLTNEEPYLLEGVHEALISELGHLDIPVIARASMAGYAASPRPIREVARELDVDRVVEGSLYRRGDSLEITARLYDGDTEREVWSGSYDGDLPNVAAMYRAFARAIAEEIEVTLSPEAEARLQRASPVGPGVYQAYLRGMHLLNQSTEEAFGQALQHFHEAVADNPADPLAYAGLALAYITLAHGPAPPPDALHLARAAAERAVRIDPTLAEGWAALADIRTYLVWDWEGAEQAFTRAAELNPSLAINHYHHAWYLALFGRATEAVAAHERARDLDPLTPLHTVWLPGLYHFLGQPERALAGARSLVERYPGNATVLYVRGIAAVELGEYDEAIAALEEAVDINPRWEGALGRAYALAGRTEEAQAIAAILEAHPTSWNAFALAELHTALGDFDAAFRWLAYEPAHGWLPWSRVVPSLVPLRTDPRFGDLMRRLNFDEVDGL